MNARHIARELALLTLFQMESLAETPVPEKRTVQELLINAVRVLTEQARELIEEGAQELSAASRAILDIEVEAPVNLNSPLDAPSKAVALPDTQQTVDIIERALLGAEYLAEALQLPELALLAKTEEVQNFAYRLIKAVRQHQNELDGLLNACSDEWRVDRLVKMDRYILRLAAAEMKYLAEISASVSINEAVILAKKFSTAESYRFINGVLGKLAETLEASKEAAKIEAPKAQESLSPESTPYV